MRAAYDSFRAQDLTAQCAALSRALLCIFFFGCACTGGGRYLCVGGVTPRMLIALLAALLALPALVRDRHTHLRSPALLLLLCFLIWLGICAVRGYLAGNRTDVLLSDVKGFLWLFLMPVCAAVVRTEAQLRRLLSAVLAGAAL